MHEVFAPFLYGLKDGGCEVGVRISSWAIRMDHFSDTLCLFANAPGAKIEIEQIEGSVFLELVCHQWGGSLKISCGEDWLRVDSYSEVHAVRQVELPGQGRRKVEIEILDDTASKFDWQVWVRRLIFAERPRWLPRTTQASFSVNLADGDQGHFLTLSNDNVISHSIEAFGFWGHDQIEAFRRYVRPGNCAVDIGANLGHHSVALGKLVGPTGRVLAFEPQKRVFRLLMGNLAINALDHIEAWDVALGEVEGSGIMMHPGYDDPDERWNVGSLGIYTEHSGLAEGANSLGQPERVQTRRLDDILAGQPVDFIKSDAQGYDLLALKGAQASIERWKPVILTEIAPQLSAVRGVDYRDLYRFLLESGYRLFTADTFQPMPEPRLWDGEDGREWDVLALPDFDQSPRR